MCDIDSGATANALLHWYARHHRDRGLPWREHGALTVTTALAEGALIQTTANIVSTQFQRLFFEVETPAAWLSMAPGEKQGRLMAMGLPTLKQSAIDGLACAMVGGDAYHSSAIQSQRGVTPHAAAMVALLHGGEGVPCDAHVERVGTRQCGDSTRWAVGVISAAMQRESVSGRPPGYEAACAISDIGVKYCRSTGASSCWACPLRRFCEAEKYMSQSALEIKEAVQEPVYSVYGREAQVVNLNCLSWDTKTLVIEVGVEDGAMTSEMLNELVAKRLPKRDQFGSIDVEGANAAVVAGKMIAGLKLAAWCRVSHFGYSVTSWVDNAHEIR